MINAAASLSSELVSLKIQFDRKEVLGEGNSSVVYKGTYEDKNVAVKKIVLNPSINGDGDNCEAQMKLDHENVLKILAVEEDDDFRYVVLELCCATFFQVIQKTWDGKGPPLPPDGEVMYQIADGLHYIHSQKLAHRDIKPENILISTNGQIKLSDFGLSQQTEGKCYVTGPKGVLLWKAPEQFQADREEIEIEIAQKSDVFSCGCVFFVYLTRENGGIHPFGDIVDHLQIYANIQEGNSINLYKANDNDPLEVDHYQLIQKMIQGDSVKRITSADVKNKIEDLLSKRNSTINPLTPQISLSNQGEPASSPQTFTVNYGKHGAKSHVKTFSNHDDYEVESCDIVCASTSFPVNSRGSSRFFPTTKNLLSSKASFQHL